MDRPRGIQGKPLLQRSYKMGFVLLGLCSYLYQDLHNPSKLATFIRPSWKSSAAGTLPTGSRNEGF
jgi:hypothetical protein